MDDRAEKFDAEDAVDTDRSNGGQAKIAGVGDVDGEGEEARRAGGDWGVGASMIE